MIWAHDENIYCLINEGSYYSQTSTIKIFDNSLNEISSFEYDVEIIDLAVSEGAGDNDLYAMTRNDYDSYDRTRISRVLSISKDDGNILFSSPGFPSSSLYPRNMQAYKNAETGETLLTFASGEAMIRTQ